MIDRILVSLFVIDKKYLQSKKNIPKTTKNYQSFFMDF